MPEGDTLNRIAHVLRSLLVGRRVAAARGRPGGAQLGRAVGSTIDSVENRAKHLLIAFDNGLTLHTHLGLQGSWHRYRRGERWRHAPSRAVAVIETEPWVAVCFDAPTVELLDTRALSLHPVLSSLGGDAGAEHFDPAGALTALRVPGRARMTVGDALLDQQAVAGLGNVYRSELCFIARIDPLTPLEEVPDEKLLALLERGAWLLRRNSAGGSRVTTAPGTAGNLYVYGRTGRPCRRCATPIRSRVVRARAAANPRRVYWCPTCQPTPAAPSSTLLRLTRA